MPRLGLATSFSFSIIFVILGHGIGEENYNTDYEPPTNRQVILPNCTWGAAKDYTFLRRQEWKERGKRRYRNSTDIAKGMKEAIAIYRKMKPTYNALLKRIPGALFNSPEWRLQRINEARTTDYGYSMKAERVAGIAMKNKQMENLAEMDHALNEADAQFNETFAECYKRQASNVKACSFSRKYRTIDGTCNNCRHPHWGAAFGCYQRVLKSCYSDGISKFPKDCNGKDLPEVRKVCQSLKYIKEHRQHKTSLFSMQYGQFADHDYSQTPTFKPGTAFISCCNETALNEAKTAKMVYECTAINVTNDPFYQSKNTTCLNVVRSVGCQTCKLGSREQTNQITCFIDGSQIYGTNETDVQGLRTMKDGELKATFYSKCGYILPQKNPDNELCGSMTKDEMSATTDCLFVAGDTRVNQQPWLMSIHIMFLRFHNKCARQFRKQYPSASDECIYQECKRITTSVFQKITMYEYLPGVIGPDMIKHYKLQHSYGYSDYAPTLKPNMYNEFVASAFRYGHSAVSRDYGHLHPNGTYEKRPLDMYFFEPHSIYLGEYDGNMVGMCMDPSSRVDPYLTNTLTNNLYIQPESKLGGLDLCSINMVRGRDHGFPGYVHYVNYFFGYNIKTFEDLYVVMSIDNIERLKSSYVCVNDIDLYIGCLHEYHQPGGQVGPTMASIIGRQHYLLKYADRYYYKHRNQAGSFTFAQMNSIDRYGMANMMCEMGDKIGGIQRDCFEIPHQKNQIKPCCQYEKFNFIPWWPKPKNGYCACACPERGFVETPTVVGRQ